MTRNAEKVADKDVMEIDSTPYPKHRVVGSKYDDMFARLKPDQCLKVDPSKVNTVSGALRKWLENHDKTGFRVRHIVRCEDGYGRVWLLREPVKMADVKGRKIVNLV